MTNANFPNKKGVQPKVPLPLFQKLYEKKIIPGKR